MNFEQKKIKRQHEMTCCPICIIKQQQTNIGNELSLFFNHFTSTLDHYIHQMLHHQIIPNTIHHFRIEQFNHEYFPSLIEARMCIIRSDRPKTEHPLYRGNPLYPPHSTNDHNFSRPIFNVIPID